MIFLLIFIASGLDIVPIPKSLTPPTYRRSLNAAYNEEDGSVYLFGGTTDSGETFSNEIWRFDIEESTWQQLHSNSPVIPEPRIGATLMIHDHIFHMHGGQTQYGPSGDIWTYNITSGMWKSIDPIGNYIGERAFSAFEGFELTDGHHIGIFGGFNMTGSTNLLYFWSLEDFSWTLMPNRGTVPKARVSASLTHKNGCLYLWGLSNGDLKDPENLYLYKYDIKGQIWSIVNSTNVNNFPLQMRQGQAAMIYDDYFYVFLGSYLTADYEPSVVSRISIHGGAWQNETFSGEPLTRNMFAYAVVEEKVLIFCGSNTAGQYNSVDEYNLHNKTVNNIFKSTFTFDRRQAYTLNRMATNLILFGGTDKYQVFDDILTYDLLTDTWKALVVKGNVPPARSGHCAANYNGLYLIIFGGESNGNKFNDMYSFNLQTLEWIEIVLNVIPVERTGCCMATYNKYIIIQGGKTVTSATDEILVFDMHQNLLKFYQPNTKPSSPNSINIQNHRCWTGDNQDYVELIIASGENNYGKPMEGIFKATFDISDPKSVVNTTLIAKTPIDINWARCGVLPLNNSYVLIGGIKWSLFISHKIYGVNFLGSTLQITDLTQSQKLKVYWYDIDIEQYGNNIYIGYSGASFSDMPKKTPILSHFYKVTPQESKEMVFFPCSEGTYLDNGNCEPCQYGRFKDFKGSSPCYECPIGSYNPVLGATSLFMCFPCKFSFYAEDSGQKFCKSCEAGHFCGVGSSHQTSYKYIDGIVVTQPPSYSESVPDPFNGYMYFLAYCTAILFFMVYLVNNKFRGKIKLIDYFSEKHEIELGKPVIKRRTSFGGLVTVCFIVFQIIYVTNIFTTYSYSNIQEDKTLIPGVVLEHTYIAKNFHLKVEFFNYPGACVAGDQKYFCSRYFYPDLGGLEGELKCSKADDACIVDFDCKNCQFTGNIEIYYRICEFMSLASGIRATATSDSSIPGYNSSTSFFIGYDDGRVFRGTPLTEFHFEITKSVFQSSLSDWPDLLTGYHIGVSDPPVYGNIVEGEDINYQECVGLKIHLDKTSSVLVTKRYPKMELILLLTTTIGSIFGMLELFAIGMSIGERIEKKIHNKVKGAIKLRDLIDIRHGLSKSFEYFKAKASLKRIGADRLNTSFDKSRSPRKLKILPVFSETLDATIIHDLNDVTTKNLENF